MNHTPDGRVPSPASSLTELGLPKPLVKALAREGIVTPTPIQQVVVPSALAGHNVLGRAKTGSGKTLSFGIPALDLLAGGRAQSKAPRGLILVPTRELATQVERALRPLASALNLRVGTVLGGIPINRQIKALKEGVDLLIATPGRLGDLVERRACVLDQVEITILDEADHLCDLGFFKPVDALLAKTPKNAQRLLLSATLDGEVDKLVQRHLPQHVLHEIEPAVTDEGTMEHHVIVSDRPEKLATARRLLEQNPRTIVFARTRRGASRLAKQLSNGGIEAVDLHGDLDQRRRERNLARFSSGDASVIVATDIAARGIHVDDVGLVVHYDAPAEHKAYTHRSGRTARAGESGTVVTMTTPEDLRDVVALQSKAGVNARQHRSASLPQTLNAETLAESGTLPEPRQARQHSGGRSRSGGRGQGGQGRGGQGGQQRRRPDGGGPSGGNRNRNRNRNRSGGRGASSAPR